MLPADFFMLFASRAARMFSYGTITVIFMIAMLQRYPAAQVNMLLTGILAGDFVISLYLTTGADALGRRFTLLVGAVLKVIAGVGFALCRSFPLVLLTGIVGIITPTGGEIGPFIAVEQASLAEVLQRQVQLEGAASELFASRMATVFAWYQLVGSVSLASGALFAGWLVQTLSGQLSHNSHDGHHRSNHHHAASFVGIPFSTMDDVYTIVFLLYALIGVAMAVCYSLLSMRIEGGQEPPSATPTAQQAPSVTVSAPPHRDDNSKKDPPKRKKPFFTFPLRGIHSSETRNVVARLAALFSVDAFAGGLVLQSFIAWWFHTRWNVNHEELGQLLLFINVVAGASGLAAGYFVRKFGAINTMVFTHLPSNVLLLAVPLMPTRATAVAMLIARFSISQMDVPARQAYVAAVVSSKERSAASGWTNTARSVGVSVAPFALTGMHSETVHPGTFFFNAPFYVSGALKCAYDLAVYFSFQATAKLGRDTVSGGGTTSELAEKEPLTAAAADARASGSAAHPPPKGRGSSYKTF